MARFFFHTNDPAEINFQDDTGVELSDIHAAKCEAVTYAAHRLCEVGQKFWDAADFEMTVTDDTGLVLFTMRIVGTEAPGIRVGKR